MQLEEATVEQMTAELFRRKVPYILLSYEDGKCTAVSNLQYSEIIPWLEGSMFGFEDRLESLKVSAKKSAT